MSFSSVEYIHVVNRYSAVFPDTDMDKLSEQFLCYHLLADKDIPASVKESAQLQACSHGGLRGFIWGSDEPPLIIL